MSLAAAEPRPCSARCTGPARCAAAAAIAAALLAAGSSARATSVVNFWISAADAGPEAPTIYALPGEASELAVWARPAAGYNLSAFALNLVAEQLGVVEFDSVTVLNPDVGGGAVRHQLVFDSAAGLIVDPDGVRGFQGLSFFPVGGGLPLGAGIGPDCDGDPECSAASGLPAWRVATIQFHAGEVFGSTELFLEIGTQGVWQSPADATEPDPPAETTAVFGLANDVVHGWSSSPGPDLRNTHLGAADAVVAIASADFDDNGAVDGADLLIWQRGLGIGDTLAEGDANGDASVGAVDLAAWRFQHGLNLGGGGVAVPEPAWGGAALGLAGLLAGRRRRGGLLVAITASGRFCRDARKLLFLAT